MWDMQREKSISFGVVYKKTRFHYFWIHTKKTDVVQEDLKSRTNYKVDYNCHCLIYTCTCILNI